MTRTYNHQSLPVPYYLHESYRTPAPSHSQLGADLEATYTSKGDTNTAAWWAVIDAVTMKGTGALISGAATMLRMLHKAGADFGTRASDPKPQTPAPPTPTHPPTHPPPQPKAL